MGIDVKHFRDMVITPTLKDMGLYSKGAVELLLGTALQESRLTYLRQLGAGPAVGVYQIEPATAKDIVFRYLAIRPGFVARYYHNTLSQLRIKKQPQQYVWDMDMYQSIDSSRLDWSNVDMDTLTLKLVTDLRFATAVARMKYYMSPLPLPDGDDIHGMGVMWKTVYNTELGAGKVEDFEQTYRKYVL